MAKMQQTVLITAAASLFSSLPNAQSSDVFDVLRFSTASNSTVETEFETGRDGVATASRANDRFDNNSIYNGSYFENLSRSFLSKNPGPAAEVESLSDHSDRPSAVVGPPCGPSPASEDEIKSLVEGSASRYGVDPDFALAVAWTESRFDRVRNSPKGARGPMQLMPDTAARYHVADVCDPASNIDGGMRYLRALLLEFKSPVIAAAAYNAGEQAVYDSGGIPAYPETVRYVASVINRQMGLSFPVKRTTNIPHRDDGPRANPPPGVIGARAPVFVGGVMQF